MAEATDRAVARAEELGIDLDSVEGSGKAGVITLRDVETHAVAEGGGEEVADEEVAEAEEPEVVNEDAPVPGESDTTEPSEEMDEAPDPTPGAVTAYTPEAKPGEDDVFDPIPVGTVVRIAADADVPERWQGADAIVTASPIQPAALDDEVSPRSRWEQNTRLPIEVKTLDPGRATFSLSREDLELAPAGRASGSRK